MARPFAGRFNAPRLGPAEADRQGRISRLAFDRLGKDCAIAFLNTHHDGLGGRPLDLALASDAGFAAVEQALGALDASAMAGEA